MARTSHVPVTTASQKSGRKPTEVQAAPKGRPDPEEDDLLRYDHLPSMSAKIRQMFADGYSRPQITRALDLRPQHVRNVLVTPLKRKP